MGPLLLLAALAASLQQAPPPPAAPSEPSVALLTAARTQIDARNLDSAAILLRLVADAPARPQKDRVQAWVLLGIVDYYRVGDSASAVAMRQALALDPDLDAAPLEASYPDVARILTTEMAVLTVQAAAAAGDSGLLSDRVLIHDCIPRCPEGMRAPQFISFPQLDFTRGNASSASGGSRSRRMHTFLLMEAVITAGGIVEPETIRATGGAARGMERDLRRGLAQAIFSPALLNGVPVRSRVQLRFDFEAEGAVWVSYTYRVMSR